MRGVLPFRDRIPTRKPASEIRLFFQFVIACDRVQQDLLLFVDITPTVELHPLAGFQILVVLEEVSDAVAPVLHSIALFGHLVSLIIGFGSVVGVDYFGLLWFLRRIPLETMLLQADRMSPLIWLGLGGLIVTGSLMEPQLETPLTLIKMGCVVGVGMVGVLALSTKRTMMRQMPRVSASVLMRGLILAAMSQSLWWSAVLIGFLNMRSTS